MKHCVICEGNSRYKNLAQHYQAKHSSCPIDDASTEIMAKTQKANYIEEKILTSFCETVSFLCKTFSFQCNTKNLCHISAVPQIR